MYVCVCVFVCLGRGLKFSEACLFSPSIEASSRVLG